MDELVTICVNKEHEAKAWAEKQAQHAKKAQELDDDVTAWGERLQTAIDQANEMCPRETVELKGRSIKKLESTIASLEKALRQQEERLGGSGEEIYKRYVKAKAVYEDNQKTIKDLKACALVSIANKERVTRLPRLMLTLLLIRLCSTLMKSVWVAGPHSERTLLQEREYFSLGICLSETVSSIIMTCKTRLRAEIADFLLHISHGRLALQTQ